MNGAEILLIGEILLLILLLCMSAFFSSSEMSLFSLSRAKLMSFKDSESNVERKIHFLMEDYHRTLISIILGNMFVNSGISMVSEHVITNLKMGTVATAVVSAFVSIVVLLLFGEISPMTVAYTYCNSWSRVVALPIFYLRKILSPVTYVVGLVCDRILDIIGRRKAKALSHEEYLSYLESCVERDAFTQEEAKLLNETFALREKKVGEVMRARVNTGFIRNTASGAEVAALIREHSQAYLPVVSGNELDTAEAIISSLAFFSLPASARDAWRTSACILKPTLYIPEKSSLSKALKTVRDASAGAALVTDEYGGIKGILTVEDIYSELAGWSVELDDQLDWQALKISDRTWLFDGMCSPELVKATCPWDASSHKFNSNTLNGIFCELTGSIPQQGDKISVGNVEIEAKTVLKNRVTRVLVTVHDKIKKETESDMESASDAETSHVMKGGSQA